MESMTGQRGVERNRGGRLGAPGPVLIGLLLAMLLLGCGGEERPFSPDCPSGQIKARVDGENGCYAYCGGGSCGVGFECIDTICLPVTLPGNNEANNAVGDGTNNGPGDPSNNRTDPPNNGGGPTNNAPGKNNDGGGACTFATQQDDCAAGQFCHNGACRTPDPAELDECQRYCDLIWGSCLRDHCTGLDPTLLSDLERECIYGGVISDASGAETSRTDGCLRDILSPAVRQQNAEFIAEESCDSLAYFRCGQLGLVDACACEPPALGGPCTGDDDCDGGDLMGACIPEIDENDRPTGFPGGYCVAGPCSTSEDVSPGEAYASEACGSAGACLVTSESRAICVDRCTSHDACREGYVCTALTLTARMDPLTMQSVPDVVASCDPGCNSDEDCAPGFGCNGGACEFACGGIALVGLCQDMGGACKIRVDASYCQLP